MVNWKEDVRKVIWALVGCCHGVYLDRMSTITTYWESGLLRDRLLAGPQSRFGSSGEEKIISISGNRNLVVHLVVGSFTSCLCSLLFSSAKNKKYLAFVLNNFVSTDRSLICKFKGSFGPLFITHEISNKLPV